MAKILGYVKIDNGTYKGVYPYVHVEENGYQIKLGDNYPWVSKKACEEVSDNEFEAKDNVNHPSHYTSGGIEVFDYIKAKLTKEQLEGYLTGNCIKYLSRYQHKNGAEDLEKMMWYTTELIKLLNENIKEQLEG